MALHKMKWTTDKPHNYSTVLRTESKTYGKAASILDSQAAFDLCLKGFRVYPGIYRNKLMLFCAPRSDIGGLKRNQPQPLHIYLSGKKGTYHRNGNTMDNRLVNLAVPGEPIRLVYQLCDGSGWVSYTSVNGEYVYLGYFNSEDEATQNSEDAADLYREILTDLLNPTD